MTDSRPPLRVAVIGAGSWGTALAAASAHGQPTLLWARSSEVAANLSLKKQNVRYLPGIDLPDELAYTASLDEVFAHLDVPGADPLIILGVPVAGMAQACRMVADGAARRGLRRLSVIWTCKGFDAETGRLPHAIAAEIFQGSDIVSGVLSGPSFAREVAQGLPVALTVASADAGLRARVTSALHGGAIRVYASEDVVGVEVGGALKNVMAIACGIGDGLGMGANARAALITRGLAEMTRLGVALGARADTFVGLTGLGDLILTATGDLSRNRRVGLEIGRGSSLDTILADMTQVAEGARCAPAVQALGRSHGIQMPITDAVCAVLFDRVPPAEAVSRLLARDPRAEGGV